MQETDLEGLAPVQEKDSGETGNGKKKNELDQEVQDGKLPPGSTALHTRRPELLHGVGDGEGKQN